MRFAASASTPGTSSNQPSTPPKPCPRCWKRYRAAGWKHLVNANQTPANSSQPTKTITDMWLHFSGADVDGVTVLTRGPKNMNVIQLACDLRPLDLMHLGGHFGIPKVDPSAVMVPAPQ